GPGGLLGANAAWAAGHEAGVRASGIAGAQPRRGPGAGQLVLGAASPEGRPVLVLVIVLVLVSVSVFDRKRTPRTDRIRRRGRGRSRGRGASVVCPLVSTLAPNRRGRSAPVAPRSPRAKGRDGGRGLAGRDRRCA